jgi:hypothetical protein
VGATPLTQLGAELRPIARERIANGQLPCVVSTRMWGGLGTGKLCDLCDKEIRPDEAEIEVEGPANRDEIRTLLFHVVCQSVWPLECARADRLKRHPKR